MDLDQLQRRLNRRYLLGGGVLFALFFIAMVRVIGWPLATVWSAPVLAGVLAYWLVQRGAGGSYRWFKRRALQEWQGQHHAFDDVPLRVRWARNRCEIAVVDVLNVLRIPAEERQRLIRRLSLAYPGGVCQDADAVWWFGESELLDWLQRRNPTLDAFQLRFRRWLEKETFPALRRKAQLDELA